jgi:hypothetical protein
MEVLIYEGTEPLKIKKYDDISVLTQIHGKLDPQYDYAANVILPDGAVVDVYEKVEVARNADGTNDNGKVATIITNYDTSYITYNTKKYIKMEEPIAVDFKTAELETTESENQFTEHLDIDDDEIIAHSPDSIKQDFGTAELETTDDENQFGGCQDMDNDDYCRWLFGDEFMENIERERERNARLYGTEDAVKMVV